MFYGTNKGKNIRIFAVVRFGSTPAPLLASVGEHVPIEVRKTKIEGRINPLSLSQLMEGGGGLKDPIKKTANKLWASLRIQ
jgi:hypothetical protein